MFSLSLNLNDIYWLLYLFHATYVLKSKPIKFTSLLIRLCDPCKKSWEKRAIFSFVLNMCAKYFTGLNEMKNLQSFKNVAKQTLFILINWFRNCYIILRRIKILLLNILRTFIRKRNRSIILTYDIEQIYWLSCFYLSMFWNKLSFLYSQLMICAKFLTHTISNKLKKDL